MIKYLFLLCSIILFSCVETKKENSSLRVSILRGPSAIAFAEWMIHPPVIDGKQAIVSIVDSPEIIRSMLIKEETEIAVLPMISAVNLYNKGVSYQLAGCPIWGTLYLVENGAAHNDSSLSIFGAGTTPDILTRYYLSRHANNKYQLNYAFSTPLEILQALIAGRVNRAVLSEPFLSIALAKDSTLRIIADLNGQQSHKGFAQTAVMFHPSLATKRSTIDSLLERSCSFANNSPHEAIQILEEKKIFAPKTLTPESIQRCKIDYQTAAEIKEGLPAFLNLINEYEPKSIGGRLPDDGFISDRQ